MAVLWYIILFISLRPREMYAFFAFPSLFVNLRLSRLFRSFMFLVLLFPSVVICPPKSSANFWKHIPICCTKGSWCSDLLVWFFTNKKGQGLLKDNLKRFINSCNFWRFWQGRHTLWRHTLSKMNNDILLNRRENHIQNLKENLSSFFRVSSSLPEKENDPRPLLKDIRVKKRESTCNSSIKVWLSRSRRFLPN